MRVIITGGGTGGHIYPALAVAEALSSDPDVEGLLYVGKSGGMEETIVPNAQIDFRGISFSGMPRKLDWRLIQWTVQLTQAVVSAFHILDSFHPTVVFGTGGYVSAPILIAANLRGIPFVIHDPDAHPGLANRFLGRWAAQVTGAFEQAGKFVHNAAFEVTGNPIRGSIGALSREESLARLHRQGLAQSWKPSDKILMVTGGSQGSRTINQAVMDALPFLIETAGFRVVHQTGGKLYDEVCSRREKTPYACHVSYWVNPFFHDMASILGLADLAVCRAGSMSLAELYLAGVPSILVPYPYAAADHQKKNALASEQAGASLVLMDEQCNGQSLQSLIASLIENPSKWEAMRQASRQQAHPDATKVLVAHLKRVSR